MSDVLNNYVRFQRGSLAAYEALRDAGQLDPNTLYFIYDGANQSVGALYMGERIISSGEITVASASLDDLTDVIIQETGVNSFLVRDENNHWISRSLDDVIALIQNNLEESAAPAQVFQTTRLVDDADDFAAIDRVVNDKTLVAGDIAIVKALIANGKNQHTAYVYDGDVWVAMDGNYSADNVYFNSDLVFTYAFGRYTPDASGSVNVPAKGINLKALLEDAYSLEVKTGLIASNPAASVNGSIKYYEIGSTGTQDVSVTLSSDGEYLYGYSSNPTDGNTGDVANTIVNDKTTGVVVNTSVEAPYVLTLNGENVEPKTAKGQIFTLAPAAQKVKTEMKVVGTVYYTDGADPVSNLGKIYPDEKIVAGSISTDSSVRARWYIPMYQGFTYSDSVVADPANVTEAQIKSLIKPTTSTVGSVAKIVDSYAYNNTKITTATAAKAWRQYFLVVPASYGWVMSGAKDSNNIDCTVRQASDITMTYGSGNNAVDVTYNVYYINNAANYGTLKITWTL